MSYEKLSPECKLFSGDYIKYYDEWKECKGCGIYVKKVIDERKPLTESYYVLKNINTGKYWHVKCNRYDYYYRPHKSKAFDLADLDIIKEIKEKYL